MRVGHNEKRSTEMPFGLAAIWVKLTVHVLCLDHGDGRITLVGNINCFAHLDKAVESGHAFVRSFASKVGNYSWIGSVQGAVATWSVIGMRYVLTIFDSHGFTRSLSLPVLPLYESAIEP